MKKFAPFILAALALLLILVQGCVSAPTVTPSPAPPPTIAPNQPTIVPTAPPAVGEPLYVAIVWHNHQPFYFRDPTTGVYEKPWVRMHAVKDYLRMPALVEKYPNVRATFNLTPSLIEQLDAFVAGAKDKYWVLAEKPADQLTTDEKRFILQHFFDANPNNIIGIFPRYKELYDARGKSFDDALKNFSSGDWRDLQIWFDLAWIDPAYQAQEPLQALIDQGRDFSEDDKKTVFDVTRAIIEAVIPEYKKLQDAGQIEVITTPYAHPILPLLYDTNLASVALPDAKLPTRFSYPNDAIAQLNLAVDIYQKHFGVKPRGLWPSEGSVAQQVVKLVADAGFKWMATDEEVLANTTTEPANPPRVALPVKSFARDSADLVQEADTLYRPYDAQFVDPNTGAPGARVSIIFRDHEISDKIGFTYSGTPGEAAAKDLLDRLHAIRTRLDAQGATGPHLVSIILDGENAWEFYPNAGNAFFNSLYERLSTDSQIKTITPSEYLAKFPERPTLKNLWAGSWIDHSFATWIGEPEENAGWEDLRRAREHLTPYLSGSKSAPPDAVEKAMRLLYAAEGSDWFWWFGSDQDSGDDASFDRQFRDTLAQVYTTLGEAPPDFVYVPIIPAASPKPARDIAGASTPTVDGKISPGDEWDKAGLYQVNDSALSAFAYGYDQKNLYVRVDASNDWSTLGDNAYLALYLGAPRSDFLIGFPRYGSRENGLGFAASHEVGVQISAGKIVSATLFSAFASNRWKEVAPISSGLDAKTLELAVPLSRLGDLNAGDQLILEAVVAQNEKEIARAPIAGPARVTLPDLQPVTPLLTIDDPPNDDRGPGAYTYPTDAVFEKQVFDLKQFTLGTDDKNIVFRFDMYGPIHNPWGSPTNLALQTFDVYIDVDHKANSGARVLLPGRNAAVSADDAWDYALWVEGWQQGLYQPDARGAPQKAPVDIAVVVDPAQNRVTVRIPRSAIPGDPKMWGVLAVVLSQDGFPSAGVWRVRDVDPDAAQFRFGGGASDLDHTRLIDVALGAQVKTTQEELLSQYTPSSSPSDLTNPDKLAQLPMTLVQ